MAKSKTQLLEEKVSELEAKNRQWEKLATDFHDISDSIELCDDGKEKLRELCKLLGKPQDVKNAKFEFEIEDFQLDSGLDPFDYRTYKLTLWDNKGKVIKTDFSPDSVEEEESGYY